MLDDTCCISNVGITVPATIQSNIVGIAGNLTTSQIATAYNFPASNGANVKIGIFSGGGSFYTSDLTASLANLGITTTPTIASIAIDGGGGGFSGSISDLENTLDLYCVTSLAPAANVVIFVGNNASTQDGIIANWNNILNRMVAENCDIITMSYAVDEIYGFGAFLEGPLANAAARGITVLAATGDYGSEGGQNLGTLGPNSVAYPATSPNVVAVGGTVLTLGVNNTRLYETASVSSGGGISTLFPVPAWQNGKTYNNFNGFVNGPAVTLTTGTLGTFGGNLIGRGVPDISAPFQSYAFWFNGAVQTGVKGTSASTPIIASMLARFLSLKNANRLPARTTANSFNSLLYANPAAYYNITTGNNDELNLTGYAATAGWDPVTGLGVPNGTDLYQTVASSGTKIKTAADTWNYVANVRVKTGATTWSNVQAIWTKTINGWSQTF